VVARPRHLSRRHSRELTTTELPTSELPHIHAVSNSAAVRRRDFLDTATSVMRALGARGALHLRSSQISGRRFHQLASRLASLQEETGCWLIVNDRVDIAAAVGAKGIQLASHSLRVDEARAVTTEIPVGISVHSVEDATEAQSQGASWCVAGTVFETPSHPGRSGLRIPFIEEVARAVRIPVIAIGGIRPEHVADLIRAGAYGIATIRGAGWERATAARETDPSSGKTGLAGAPGAPAEELITRYISVYDWDSVREQDHHTDGERRATGDSAG
jgi:thiazole tautomerase (transcriptional regulator TenI)